MAPATPLPSPFRLPALGSAALAVLLLAGCDREGPREAGAAPEAAEEAPVAALGEDFEGTWQGVLPCVDCAGIEVELTLRRNAGEGSRFQLIERYLGGAAEGEFATEGEWRETGCALDGDAGRCIVLPDAAQQWFRHEDGSLQALDAEGRPLDPDGARLLRL